jgi:phosphoglycerate dehydrogenase-like enzyme
VKVLLMYEPRPSHREALRAAAPAAEFAVAHDEASAAAAIAGADAVLGNRFLVQSLPRARRLRWVQSNSMGVDRVLGAREHLRGVTLTCARGVYDGEVGEHAVALVLALVRGLHLARDAQNAARWDRRPLRRVAGLRVLVLGWGGVGRAAGGALAALGARVEGARRRHASGVAADDTGTPVWGDGWRDALPATDVLVMALPLTQGTRRIVGAAELAALAPGALVVNVGRGGTLDEEALVAALRSGRLGGAALDVFETEPLPRESPLWREPRLMVSPPSARSDEPEPHRWEPLFVENLRRFAAGEALLNVVDQDAGY